MQPWRISVNQVLKYFRETKILVYLVTNDFVAGVYPYLFYRGWAILCPSRSHTYVGED